MKSDFGYRAKLDDETLHEHVRRDPGVRLVETNRPVWGIQEVNSTEHQVDEEELSGAKAKRCTQLTQESVPYGLQMLSSGSKLATPVLDRAGSYVGAMIGSGVP